MLIFLIPAAVAEPGLYLRIINYTNHDLLTNILKLKCWDPQELNNALIPALTEKTLYTTAKIDRKSGCNNTERNQEVTLNSSNGSNYGNYLIFNHQTHPGFKPRNGLLFPNGLIVFSSDTYGTAKSTPLVIVIADKL